MLKKTLLAVCLSMAIPALAHAEATVSSLAYKDVSYKSVIIKTDGTPPAELLPDNTLKISAVFANIIQPELQALNKKYGFDRYYRIDLKDEQKKDSSYINTLMEKISAGSGVELVYPEREPAFSGDVKKKNAASEKGFPLPDFRALQGYLKASHNIQPGNKIGGVGFDAAENYPGARGKDITLVSVEVQGWNDNHVNLPAKQFVVGENSVGDAHTGAMGIMAAKDIGAGIIGIAYNAKTGYVDSDVKNLHSIIPLLHAGDVVRIGLDTAGGEVTGCKWKCAVPVEMEPAFFDVIRALTDRGVHVVESSGRSYQTTSNIDLDHPGFEGRFDITKHDSGAIIAGDIKPTDGTHLIFTPSGKRITSSAWGWMVLTTGKGDLYDKENAEYTDNSSFINFNSDAIVAGVVASLSGIAKAQGFTLLPRKMREILNDTGTQLQDGDSLKAGTQPDLERAIPVVLALKITTTTDRLTVPQNQPITESEFLKKLAAKTEDSSKLTTDLAPDMFQQPGIKMVTLTSEGGAQKFIELEILEGNWITDGHFWQYRKLPYSENAVITGDFGGWKLGKPVQLLNSHISGKMDKAQSVELNKWASCNQGISDCAGTGTPGSIYQDITLPADKKVWLLTFSAGNSPWEWCSTRPASPPQRPQYFTGDQRIGVRVESLAPGNTALLAEKEVSLGFSTERDNIISGWLKPNWRQETLSFTAPSSAAPVRITFSSLSEEGKACAGIITEVDVRDNSDK